MGTGSLSVCICIYDNIRHSLTKRVSFCSSFKALSTDTSFIKIGVCYQKLSTLEFNFHYRLSIVPVGVVYEIYQHKISRTEFIPVQQNLLSMKQGG